MVQRNKFTCALLVALTCTFIGLMRADQALAQGAVTTATVTGDVLDKAGAVLPNARVSVRNRGTGLTRETISDDGGHFIVPQLPAGSYEVSIELAGFKKAIMRDLLLNIGATETLRITLDVGDLVESIDVSAETVVGVETTKTEVSEVIQEIQVRELPLNQRSFTALVTQQAGLVQLTNTAPVTPSSLQLFQGSQISANGLPATSIGYLMDGVSINNSGFGAPGTASGGDIPGVEAIQEFKVLTHNYSAAYGGSAGAVVSFATRSGTNGFHGSVYEFLRNDVLDARGPFDTLDLDGNGQADVPPFRRNQFGATLGGPIKHDKTFFFINYEGLRQRLTTTDIGNVPNVAARNGGVGGTSGFPVIGPIRQADGTYKRGPVAIPAGVKALLELYPLPNGRDFGNGIAQVSFENKQPIRQDFLVGKIDHNLSSRDLVSGRYSVIDADGSSAFNVPTFEFPRDNRLQNFAIKWTRTISPNLVNTVSFGFVRSKTIATTGSVVPLKPSQFTGNPGRGTIGTISVGAVGSGNISGSLSNLGIHNGSPARLILNHFPINDDLLYTRGTHVFKVGGMINRLQQNWQYGQILGGSYNFVSLNDLLAGNPSFLVIHRDGPDGLPVPTYWGIRTTQFAWYVEDAWRMRRNLTITVGLRHEFQVPIMAEVNNRLGNIISQQTSEVTVGQPFNNYSLKQFQPRLGIAYDPFNNGKTVIRAGVGLFNDFLSFSTLSGTLTGNAPEPTINSFFGEPLAPDLNFFRPIEFPTCASCTVPTGYSGLVTGVLNPVNAPTSIQWNLQIERELPAMLKFTIAYTGSQSYHLIRQIEGNHSLPCRFENGQPVFTGTCGTAAPEISKIAFSFFAIKTDTNASYHGLTVGLARVFSKGFSFDTRYAFAKSISESDNFAPGQVLENIASASQYPPDRKLDRAESAFSIRHRFTVNALYELPFGHGKKFLSNAGSITNALLGNWSLSALGEFRSGFPFSVMAGFGITGVGDPINVPDRPNILRYNAVAGHVDRWFDPKAYALQEPGRLGNAPRTSVRGPDFKKLDFSLIKKFNVGERAGIECRAEFFNILNHPNFALPFNQVYVGFAPEFDHVPTQAELDALPCNLTAAQAQVHSCNPLAGVITRTVSTPRQVQFGLKVTF
ncbi:MAG: TonB-dependent receptor [Acidobacteria bacterium]|nr:TonB-dependent receptor [Acidobacteriota bacterium]